jgi:hypothetical protein
MRKFKFLNDILPKRKLEVVEQIKTDIFEQITKNLSKYHTTEDIDDIIKANQFNINEMIENDPSLLKANLWNRLLEINSIGGINYFVTGLKRINSLHTETTNSLIKVQVMLYVIIFNTRMRMRKIGS